MDVKMLGTGRPFYFELINPKTLSISEKECQILQDQINIVSEGKIMVRDLQIVDKDSLKILKDSAATKRKSYRFFITNQ